MTDHEMARLVASGDTRARTEFVMKFLPEAMKVLFRRCKGAPWLDPAGLAHEAIVDCIRFVGQWKGRGSLAAWVQECAANRFIDEVRRPPPVPTLPEEFLRQCASPRPSASPSPRPDTLARSLFVHRAISLLPDSVRLAAILVFELEKRHSVVADLLGVHIRTVERLVHEAKLLIRAKCQEFEEQGGLPDHDEDAQAGRQAGRQAGSP